MQRLFALLAATLVLAGCTSAVAITEATAKAAPDRLKADMGPAGSLSSASTTMQMSMAMTMGDSSMSMRMEMEAEQEFYQDGALEMTIRFTDFQASGQGMDEMPDFSNVVLHIFCAPDRWVLTTEGMEDLGGADLSSETRNSQGVCVSDGQGNMQDLSRLMAGLSGLESMSSSFTQGLQAPKYQFRSLDGDTATYNVAGVEGMQGMKMQANITANFDSEGRLAHTEFALDMAQMSMHMESTTDFVYGGRDVAPDVHGDRKV